MTKATTAPPRLDVPVPSSSSVVSTAPAPTPEPGGPGGPEGPGGAPVDDDELRFRRLAARLERCSAPRCSLIFGVCRYHSKTTPRRSLRVFVRRPQVAAARGAGDWRNLLSRTRRRRNKWFSHTGRRRRQPAALPRLLDHPRRAHCAFTFPPRAPFALLPQSCA